MKKASTTMRTLLVALAFFVSGTAHADSVLLSNTNTSFISSGASYYHLGNSAFSSYQKLGTGLQGVVNSIVGAVSFNSSPNSMTAQILCFTDSAYTTPCTGSVVGSAATTFATLGGGTSAATSTLGTPYQFDPTKYYELGFNLVAHNDGFLYGGTENTYPNGSSVQGTASGCSSACPADLYFLVYGVLSIQPQPSSVSAFTTPTNQSTTGSASVEFAFTYYNADTYNYKGVRIHDLTTQGDVGVPALSITVSGSGSYDQTLTLQANHFYSAQPYILDNITNDVITGPMVFFSTVSDQEGNFANLATSTEGTGLFGNVLGVFQPVMNKVPFAWVAQIVDVIVDAAATTTDGNFPSFTIGIPRLQSISAFSATDTVANVDMFSTSTVKNAQDSAFIETVDTLLAAMVYLSVTLAVFYLAMRQFD